MMIIKEDIYFHEDDYCQQELVPVQNLLSKRNELNNTKAKLKEVLSEDGFISMSINDETKYPLERLLINVNDFEYI